MKKRVDLRNTVCVQCVMAPSYNSSTRKAEAEVLEFKVSLKYTVRLSQNLLCVFLEKEALHTPNG